jgi:hypothetical protein
MKNAKSKLSVLLVVAVLGVSGASLAADGVVVQGELKGANYCHEKIPAMRSRTLSDSQPELKDSGTGDVIDFYGPCDEDPTGSDQITTQKLEAEHHMDGSRADSGGRF